MKVTISALSRFHLFQMARQLLRYEFDLKVITAYPSIVLKKKWLVLWSIAITLPSYALMRALIIRANRYGFTSIADKLQHHMHVSFSTRVVRVSKSYTNNMIIGMSSFMKEAILGSEGIMVVDHGSLHIETEKKLLKRECAKFGFKESGNWKHDWMIDRMKFEFEHADYIFCCSDLAKETMISNGVKPNKIFSNPLGVDLSMFSYKRCISERKFRFLHVSNMGPIKGLQYFIPAFKQIESSDIELWLVGPRPNETILNEMIDSDSRIIYLGYKPESELASIYSECDVFVHPSIADGWAMTVLQSMAVGTPAIVSDMTGAKQIINHGQNGWIVPHADQASLFELMYYLTTKKADLINTGKNAHDSVQDNFTWDAYGDRLNKWINEVTS
ncbi:glycosyltransferase family 4 protein [Vibrio diazotrophicus]|uniref:glycosyltransferase family 4 protein n=1 Tax=Vibrio diazotrophicus TaxID=685 RepID=UPI000C9DCC01|nr:glycosyltransferase family 4 protein [Vibrio diazotrophicus]PNH94610.1 hypothetical protein C1M59_00800 [Vibrio diazotrophicus]